LAPMLADRWAARKGKFGRGGVTLASCGAARWAKPAGERRGAMATGAEFP